MFPTSLLLLASLLDLQEPPTVKPPKEAPSVWQILREKYDANDDGRITKAEHERGEEAFRNLDRNQDGVLTESDTQATPVRQRGRRSSQEKQVGKNVRPPAVGEKAPDFELQVLLPEAPLVPGKKIDGKGNDRSSQDGPAEAAPPFVKLSSFAGKKPVALVFGSYT